jgi:hypothetical protein
MCKLLIICDTFALKYGMVFNADMSKFFIVVPARWRNLCDSFNQCVFYIGGKSVEKVITYPHLGHIISANLDDTADAMHRRSHFIGQVFMFARWCWHQLFMSSSFTVRVGLFLHINSSPVTHFL